VTYKVVIPGRLPSLNEYLSACASHPQKGARLKRENEDLCIVYIRKYMRGIKITKPIEIHYRFFEKNTKRDRGNIGAMADKVFEDALQKANIIHSDDWYHVVGIYYDEFSVDNKSPRIEIEIVEVE